MKSQIAISPSGESLTIERTLQYQNIIEEGYIHPIAEVRLETKNFESLKEELIKDYNIKILNYKSNDTNFQIWKCDKFTMDVLWETKNMFVTTYCKTQNINVEIFQILAKYEPKSGDVDLYMDNYFSSKGQLDHNLKVYKADDFEYANKLFYPYINTDAMFTQLYTNKENIIILCGEPGTGKTSLTSQLLKFSLENTNILPHETDIDSMDKFVQVAYIKSTEVLAMDEFWRTLASKDYDLVILDDLDYFLTSRDQEVQTQEDSERNKFLSQFLSFTDGIEQNKTNFIITTNQPFNDIDSALLRKGRLFDILELRKLKNTEALDVWIKAGLSEDTFMFAGEVLQADLGSEIEKQLNTEIVIEDYLLDETVSKLKRFTKKIGF